jgi:hypothetical protein
MIKYHNSHNSRIIRDVYMFECHASTRIPLFALATNTENVKIRKLICGNTF